jgi:hypothetical protein
MIGSLSRRRTGEVKTTQQRVWNGHYFEIWDYRYLNQVPLREQQPVLLVNWCEVTVKRQSDGQLLYRNSWITNHDLTPQRVILLCWTQSLANRK